VDALLDGADESLRAAGAALRLASSPRASLTGTLRRAALAIGEDVLRPAPTSYLNRQIGPRRTLVRARSRKDLVLAARRPTGATVNDVCLAAVAGGMRELALRRGEMPRPLRAMVPVSVRREEERSELGNRISFAFIDLPVDDRSPANRLRRVREQTAAFKRSRRPQDLESVLKTLGLLPGPLRTGAVRLAGSPRLFNLTVSNVPGPDFPVYMLGAELAEAHPVVPLSEGHALSIGIFGYRDSLFFGIYADPTALPEARELPAALNASMLALARGARRVEARSRRPNRHPTRTLARVR
jgi:WS/DGAT/MGAT family acyltransferase